MNGILSYCWFHDPRTSNRPKGHFSKFAPAVLRAARAIYPDLELVIHHDATLDDEPYGAEVRRLASAGVLRLVERQHGRGISEASLWRLLPVWEAGSDLVVCRDLDSIPTVRERRMVEAFATSGMAIHCINDHPAHCSPRWPAGGIMTGTCAMRAPQVVEKVHWWQDILTWGLKHGMGFDAYGHDEAAINLMMQPMFEGRIMGHFGGWDEQIPLTAEIPQRAIDNPRAYTEYIGMCLRDHMEAARFYAAMPGLEAFGAAP